MKVGSIYAKKEAVNFLLDKVGDPYISRFIPSARKASFAIVPDLHARNCPTGRQRVIDSAATTAAARSSRSRHARHAKADMITIIQKQGQQTAGLHSSRRSVPGSSINLIGSSCRTL